MESTARGTTRGADEAGSIFHKGDDPLILINRNKRVQEIIGNLLNVIVFYLRVRDGTFREYSKKSGRNDVVLYDMAGSSVKID